MRIGFITSYHAVCGISQYSENLINELISKGIQVKVVANYPVTQTAPDEVYIRRLFHVPFMNHQITAEVDKIIDYLKDCDLVHIMFETSLYHTGYFKPICERLKALNKKLVFTMHSSGMWPEFDIRLIDRFITHEKMWCSTDIIPMGVKLHNKDINPKTYKSVTSFGLGRNNDKLIIDSIFGMDIEYRTNYGSNKWLNINDLVDKVQESWVISLLYPEVGANVSSSAIMLAMGLFRPILVSNTNWFKHIINYPNIYVCENLDDIKKNLEYLTNINNIVNIKEDINNMVISLIENKRTFNDFVNQHIEIYKNILKS